jgi:hypothetical protein
MIVKATSSLCVETRIGIIARANHQLEVNGLQADINKALLPVPQRVRGRFSRDEPDMRREEEL